MTAPPGFHRPLSDRACDVCGQSIGGYYSITPFPLRNDIILDDEDRRALARWRPGEPEYRCRGCSGFGPTGFGWSVVGPVTTPEELRAAIISGICARLELGREPVLRLGLENVLACIRSVVEGDPWSSATGAQEFIKGGRDISEAVATWPIPMRPAMSVVLCNRSGGQVWLAIGVAPGLEQDPWELWAMLGPREDGLGPLTDTSSWEHANHWGIMTMEDPEVDLLLNDSIEARMPEGDEGR